MKDLFKKEALTQENSKWQEANKRLSPLYERENDIREPFERDYTRILHCRAYRRLKHKTQVFFATTNDHVCTRMEHTNHVCSVSSTIAKYLGLNTQLTSSIALGHDIGHAPFGHHGEDCLNLLLEKTRGKANSKRFWHEKNSLFFADFIETLRDPLDYDRSLNLTYAVRDGMICHCGEINESGIKPRNELCDLYSIKEAGSVQPFTWEGAVVKLADKIAFLGRDIEDARISHILDMASYRKLHKIVDSTLGVGSGNNKKAINTTVLINDLIVDLCNESTPEKGLCFSPRYFDFISAIKEFSVENIYNHWRLKEFQKYATTIIETLYYTLMKTQNYAKNGKLDYCLKYYPQLQVTFEDWLIRYSNYRSAKKNDLKEIMHSLTEECFNIEDEKSFQKCIIEYISGMTDNFAISAYKEIITF